MARTERVKYDFGKKCVCVGRVSTPGQSQTAQLRDLEEYAHSCGYDIIEPFFTTESGFLEFDEKQGWNRVTDFFNKHPDYRVLICPEISRLSRKEHILHKIKDYLIQNKIQLIVKDINFVLFNDWGEIPAGNDIIFALYSSLADSEMRSKKERFTRVLKDNRQQGYSIGGKELFGYDRVYEMKDGRKRSKYLINEKEATEIRTIYKWYAYGIDGDVHRATALSITKECIERGFSVYLHSKRNVAKCLKEEAYCGIKETHNRIKNPDYWNYHKYDAPKYIEGQSYVCRYPAILTGDDAILYDIAKSRMRENNTRYTGHGDNLLDKSSKHTNLLAKLLVCPVCGTYLISDYRMAQHSQRPHLGKRAAFTYRCNYSRGVVNVCSFKRCISLPMLDSIIWSYCRNVALMMIVDNQHKDVRGRTAEIDLKIDNVTKQIQEFDIDSRIKTEDAILRARTRTIKDPAIMDQAVKEYEKRVKQIAKDLRVFKTRKRELEQEKEDIIKYGSIADSVAQVLSATANKQTLYKYIHSVIDKIEFIAWDKFHLVLKVHYKKAFIFHKKNEFLCVYSKTTKEVNVLLVNSYDPEQAKKMMSVISDVEFPAVKVNDDDIRFMIDNLPSTDNLHWDTGANNFIIDGIALSFEDIKDWYEHPKPFTGSENDLLSIAGRIPISIRKLTVERLQCYDEDIPNHDKDTIES